MDRNISKYIKAFRRLKRGNTKYGVAPHKPVLLISLIELFSKGLITENKVHVDADLVGTFKENWLLLVPTLHHPDFTQPFFYLQNDKAEGLPFWFLSPVAGMSITAHVKNVQLLANLCDHGFFSQDLYKLLDDPLSREVILMDLLATYFPNEEQSFRMSKQMGRGYLEQSKLIVLNEPEVRLMHIDKHIELDVFVRGGLFKKLIPKVYHRTCSITGIRLESTYAHNFIDACHIIPFSVTQDDTVKNGIALCPNMHRAFDRGLITVDDQYQVLVSNQAIEDKHHPYSLNRHHGQQLILPNDQQHYPSRDNLAWHRANIFKS